MGLRERFRRLRGTLTGLNAVSARFDLLQNRLDALAVARRELDEDLGQVRAAITTRASSAEVLGLARELEKLQVLPAIVGESVRRLDEENADDRVLRTVLATQLEAHGERLNDVGVSLEVLGQALGRVDGRIDALGESLAALPLRSDLTVLSAGLAQAHQQLDAVLSTAQLSVRSLRGGALVGPASAVARLPLAGEPTAGWRAGGAEHRLAFLLQSLELINHFAPVWDQLPGGSFDVVLHGVSEALAREALKRWDCGVSCSEDVLRESRRYHYLVSNHPVEGGEPPLIQRLARQNVRFMYAAGKSGWNLSAWNSLYDLILCFGPHHAAAFTASTDAVVLQMGYPRFDRFFNEQIAASELYARFDCDLSRETVVWLPTWKSLSSVGLFDTEISALTEHYNVVVKLHPLMSESEPERVSALRKHRFTHLICDSSDNLGLYQLADYMLFDYGGPPLAGIYADKRLILLSVPGAEIDPLTGPESPDLHIRQYLGEVRVEEGAIAGLLADSVHWVAQTPIRKMLRKTYFAPHFGFSANVAADALLRLELILDGRD